MKDDDAFMLRLLDESHMARMVKALVDMHVGTNTTQRESHHRLLIIHICDAPHFVVLFVFV